VKFVYYFAADESPEVLNKPRAPVHSRLGALPVAASESGDVIADKRIARVSCIFF
jgi:hypothetical protein